jgi:Arc-like DNA binding domain
MSSNHLRREALSSTSRLTLHRVWAELQRAAAENPISPKPPTATERAIPPSRPMHPDNRQQSARLNVRLDDKLRSRIEAAAQASRRSMNAEICHRIEQAFIEQRSDEATATSTAA